MTTLYLVRHGETDWNRDHRVQGHADPPLNETGRAQARDLGARLAGIEFAAAYSSDLQRARQTAEILLDGRDLALNLRPSLRERFLGRWEGHLTSELATLDPEAWRVWLADARDTAPHGGETEDELECRALAAVEKIATAHPTAPVLVVSHGGTLRAILRGWLGHDVHNTPNCGVYVVSVDGDSKSLAHPGDCDRSRPFQSPG